MKHVIIGAGAAGIQAAKTIRALMKDAEILVISTDTHVVPEQPVFRQQKPFALL